MTWIFDLKQIETLIFLYISSKLQQVRFWSLSLNKVIKGFDMETPTPPSERVPPSMKG